ncbi:zinc finger protein 598-like [Brachionus plicatilis]|uniref:Zinc finger protein 598-like n=1 Tax=Brachionus plicatilis TaxID=10195 RepID=A0A3M7QRQ0_BRAPC|nr:zinc finger protein 598-like [Brachionus plicatilis]
MNSKTFDKNKRFPNGKKNSSSQNVDQPNSSTNLNENLKFSSQKSFGNDLSSEKKSEHDQPEGHEPSVIDIQVSNEQKNKIYNRRKLISCSEDTQAQPITCICCLHELYTYTYYACSHFVCLNCSAKMRILCKKLDCPICRNISQNVYCTKKAIELKNFEPSLSTGQNLVLDQEAGMFCDQNNSLVKSEFEEILCNRCDICPKTLRPFQSFKALDNHMKKVHRRFYCELCLENLKLFTFERKHYTREELAVHKRHGDRDDFSFKGHPTCEYCDVRYFDKDELYRHFRKDHYYCHFCDSDGIEEYYKDYNQLRQHFLKAHYLCELDTCSFNAAQTHEYVVFRSDLDFQAHKRQQHAKTKLEQKNLGKLNIEFNLTNSARDRHKRQHGNPRAKHSDEREPNRPSHRASADSSANQQDQPKQDVAEAYAQNEQDQSQQVESVLEAVEEPTPASQLQNNWGSLIKSKPAPKFGQEAEFPSLIAGEKNGVAVSCQSSTWNRGLSLQHSKKVQPNFSSGKSSKNSSKKDRNFERTEKSKMENLLEREVEPPPGYENFFPRNNFINFIKPQDYEERNKSLDSKICDLFQHFDKSEFQKFKNYSIDFRIGLMNAQDYLLMSQQLLNLPISLNAYKNNKNSDKKRLHAEFLSSIQELLILLPDVSKQNELFAVLDPLLDTLIENDSKNSSLSQQSKWVSKNDEANFSKKLTKCPGCSQYLSSAEINFHQTTYHKGLEVKTLTQNEVTKPQAAKFNTSPELEFKLPKKQEFSKKEPSASHINENDFPSLTFTDPKTPIWNAKQPEPKTQVRKENNYAKKNDFSEDFPALESSLRNNAEFRISSLPTPTIFQNPSSHLSILNKKKHRLQK